MIESCLYAWFPTGKLRNGRAHAEHGNGGGKGKGKGKTVTHQDTATAAE